MIYPIYIPSKNRPDAKFLELIKDLDTEKHLILEPQDIDKYSKWKDYYKILNLQQNDQGLPFARDFGKKLSEIPVPDTKSKKDLKIANTIPEKDLLELDALKQLNNALKQLNKKLQEENAKLKAQNEKLKLLSSKNLEENKASKQLIVELLKENEKIKFEKEIFKNKILKEENKKIIEEVNKKPTEEEINRFALFLFITILILMAYGITSFVVSISQAIFKNKQY